LRHHYPIDGHPRNNRIDMLLYYRADVDGHMNAAYANCLLFASGDAKVLIKLIPVTVRRFGVPGSFNPKDKIPSGMSYLRWFLRYFKGDAFETVAT